MNSELADTIAKRFGANHQAAIAIDEGLRPLREYLRTTLDAETPGLKESGLYQRGLELWKQIKITD